MVSIKKFKEVIQKGLCIVDDDLTDAPPMTTTRQQQRGTNSTVEGNGQPVPSLTHDEDISEEEEEELGSEPEIYQTEYSPMDPEEVETSYEETHEKYMNALENIIFEDNPWEMDKGVMNAYEYINPVMNDKFDQLEPETDDTMYQLRWADYMTPEQVDQSYKETYIKYFAYITKINLLKKSNDPWTENTTVDNLYNYVLPTDVNPYVLIHPFDDNPQPPLTDDTFDYIYQTEYDPMDPKEVEKMYQESIQKFKDDQSREALISKAKALSHEPWY